MLTGNTNWNARTDLADQAPSYFVKIDGVSSKHYATHAVYNPLTSKEIILGLPDLEHGAIDLLSGAWSPARVRVPFYDVAGKASTLFGVGGGSAPVTTWKNRKVSLWGGYRGLREADFLQLFTGRVTGLSQLGERTGYLLELSDSSYLLDAEIMTGSTDITPATIRGNVVNVLASILRGVFSTSDADFPLDLVSTDTGSTSAPTGLGIADAELDIDGMKAERDTWRPRDVVELQFLAPEGAKAYLQREFFRTFQARLQVRGDGKLGFRFNAPALPASAAPVVDLDTTVELLEWQQLLDHHLNKFTFRGDYDPATNEYDAVLYSSSTTEDTADRAATGETIEYVCESKWIREEYDGLVIARELAGRLRQLWLPCPARVVLSVNFRQRRLEVGDVIAVTHPDIPDQRTGVLGVANRLMTILRMEPNISAGQIELECLDVGLRRYGVIAPSSKTGDYSTASGADRGTFFFICNSSLQVPDGSDGYRLI